MKCLKGLCGLTALLLASTCPKPPEAIAAKPAPQTTSEEVHARAISSSGETTVSSGPGFLGTATATFQTEEPQSACALICPTSRDWLLSGRTSQVSLVQKLSISLNGKPIRVPALAYVGMYEPSWAMIRKKGSSFVLTVALADEGAGYFAKKIYFDETGVKSIESSSSDCGISDRTTFLFTTSKVMEPPEGLPPARGKVAWRSLYILGKIALSVHTTRGNALVIIDQLPFEHECVDGCPDARTTLGSSSDEQLFRQEIDFLVGDKLVYGPSIRNLVASSAAAFLGTSKDGFVLWIKAQHGATEDFEEILFNSKTLTEVKRWLPSQHLIEDTRVYPPGCE
jgi:hypothetical protein